MTTSTSYCCACILENDRQVRHACTQHTRGVVFDTPLHHCTTTTTRVCMRTDSATTHKPAEHAKSHLQSRMGSYNFGAACLQVRCLGGCHWHLNQPAMPPRKAGRDAANAS